MLRSFRVANHKSIREEQELLLIPAYDKARPVLPVAAVFGANASGKSNLLDALAFMRRAVRTSYAEWEPGAGVPRSPFRLDPQTRSKPSLFVVELLLGGSRYTYGFAVDDERVTEEWLYAYPRNRKRIVFERDGQGIEFGSTIKGSRASLIADSTRPNALALSSAARANQPDVMPVYEWFRGGLDWPSSGLDASTTFLTDRLAAGDGDASALVDLIRAADLGIADVQVDRTFDEAEYLRLKAELDRRPSEAPDKAIWLAELADGLRARREQRRPSLTFLHGPHAVPLKLADQSEGTRTWLRLVAAALKALDEGAVLAVDEIDTSLHPRLTARLIELFRDERTNVHNGQLLFTTHDATLLGTSFGKEILGRDEVWFVEKDGTGTTKLFPLSDFHPRKEENTERRYLGGSYGAVPAVFSDTLVEQLLKSRAEPGRAAS
jgi:hypothetical protein